MWNNLIYESKDSPPPCSCLADQLAMTQYCDFVVEPIPLTEKRDVRSLVLRSLSTGWDLVTTVCLGTLREISELSGVAIQEIPPSFVRWRKSLAVSKRLLGRLSLSRDSCYFLT